MKKYLIAVAVFLVLGAIIGAIVLVATNDEPSSDAGKSVIVDEPAGTKSVPQIEQIARDHGFFSADEMFAADCRSRRGTWSNGECLCASPSSWYTTETQECCVDNTRAYERRQDSCHESGGRYTCRGGCRCPMGLAFVDGQCIGETATPEEIESIRSLLAGLECESDNDCDMGLECFRRECSYPCRGALMCPVGMGCNSVTDYCEGEPSCPDYGPEICGDAIDNDCNGVVDDGCACTPGVTLPCGPGNRGVQTCYPPGLWGDCSLEGAAWCDENPEACVAAIGIGMGIAAENAIENALNL